MKRYVESFLIILIIACSYILECKARSKTWFYPDYIIKDADANVILYWREYFLLMLVIAILFILEVELVRRGKWKFAIIPFAACIVFTAVFGIRYQYSIGLVINEAEELVMGTYVLICYGVAGTLEHGRIRNIARPAYLLFHVGAVIFCSWSYICDEIYISPVVVLQMTVIFLIVYNYVFQSGKQLMSKKRKVIASVVGIIAFTVIFSFTRLKEILLNLESTEVLSNHNENWLSYREAAFQTMITGDYSNQALDPATMNNVKSYTMRWLGTAFGRKEQMIYILLLSAFLILLMWMYCSKKDLPLKMVISAIVFSNLCGIVCEMNLFYSAEVGVLASRNLYQLIPVVYLAYVNVRREDVSRKEMIEMKYFGEYQCEFTDGKVNLPEKFQMADKDLIMQVIEGGDFLFVQLEEEISDEKCMKDEIESITVLEEKKIHIDKNGCFVLPEVYLSKVEITEDSDIVVLGIGSIVEIFIKNRKTRDCFDDREFMISILNAPGESLSPRK